MAFIIMLQWPGDLDYVKQKTWYIGLHDSVGDGLYSWQDGSLQTFSMWRGSGPHSRKPNEQCVVYKREGEAKNDVWSATDCINRFPYICEKDPGKNSKM